MKKLLVISILFCSFSLKAQDLEFINPILNSTLKIYLDSLENEEWFNEIDTLYILDPFDSTLITLINKYSKRGNYGQYKRDYKQMQYKNLPIKVVGKGIVMFRLMEQSKTKYSYELASNLEPLSEDAFILTLKVEKGKFVRTRYLTKGIRFQWFPTEIKYKIKFDCDKQEWIIE
ncbi:MAG: hypothetical protein H8E98_04820 [Bacteroidetes bacterium]|nr:hypothetical protein [Bacteroidota bacterium]